MKWYIAKVVFHIKIHDGNTSSQFDEQCLLIQAASEADALNKAADIGKAEEEGFINDRNNLVQWNFIDVVAICEIQEWKHGSTLYSKTSEFEEPDDHIYYAEKRGESLRQKWGSLAIKA